MVMVTMVLSVIMLEEMFFVDDGRGCCWDSIFHNLGCVTAGVVVYLLWHHLDVGGCDDNLVKCYLENERLHFDELSFEVLRLHCDGDGWLANHGDYVAGVGGDSTVDFHVTYHCCFASMMLKM